MSALFDATPEDLRPLFMDYSFTFVTSLLLATSLSVAEVTPSRYFTTVTTSLVLVVNNMSVGVWSWAFLISSVGLPGHPYSEDSSKFKTCKPRGVVSELQWLMRWVVSSGTAYPLGCYSDPLIFYLV